MKKLLNFLNLLDYEGNLSISNIAAIVCITKVAFSHDASVADLGALTVSMLNYAHKRLISADNQGQ